MTWEITGALALEFDWTSLGSGADGTITVNADPAVNITVASKAGARFFLAPSGDEFAAHVQTAINTALAAALYSETVTLAWGTDGRLTASISAGTMALSLHPSLNRILGFIPTSGAASSTADEPPMYLGLFASGSGGTWEMMQTVSAETTAGGTVYGFDSGARHWRRTVTWSMVPATQDYATDAGYPGTPLRPTLEHWANLGSTATARRWSVADLLAVAPNAAAALTVSDFQTLRTGTTVRYHLGRLASDTLQALRTQRQDTRWPRYESWEMGFVSPGTAPTATRA